MVKGRKLFFMRNADQTGQTASTATATNVPELIPNTQTGQTASTATATNGPESIPREPNTQTGQTASTATATATNDPELFELIPVNWEAATPTPTPTGRKEINNPFNAVTSKVSYLVYWENPIHSGIVLATGLLVIIYTSYYSLINTYFALIISLLGLNWIIVIGKKQFQTLSNTKYTNPFEKFLVDKPMFIKRETIEKYLDICVDGVNFLLLEFQKIILVENPSKTFKYIVSLYFLWTILGWFSIRTLASIVLVLGFSVPMAYKRNKSFFDEKLNRVHDISNSYCEHATGLLKHHTKGVVEKSKNAINKSWGTKEE
ncbi:6398_t:CDS:2 [Diversispora eburnea]|uniref:Reticulon-like protein n=1 Tax=Diversispora eburnea TaxID=1213867 RepID=A0A9N9AKB0_9GLOM|nr:6398_t:CDS:2 [Diversispora eburnea]